MVVDLGNRPALLSTLAWTASLGAVTAEALAVRERISVAAARGRLASAERTGAMCAWRLLRGRPALYTLTAAGQRALGLPGAKPVRVSASRAEHMIACCEVAAALELLYPERRLIGEAELLRSGSPLACVQVTGRNAPGTHRADLALLPRSGSRSTDLDAVESGAVAPTGVVAPTRAVAPTGAVAPPGAARSAGALAVEVELTVKEPRRLLAICTAWARCREVDGVLYVVAPAVRLALERAVDGARAERWIAIAELSELVSLIREPHPKRRVAWDRRGQTSTMEMEKCMTSTE